MQGYTFPVGVRILVQPFASNFTKILANPSLTAEILWISNMCSFIIGRSLKPFFTPIHRVIPDSLTIKNTY
ncbi:hypothetical protein GIB67_017949 [Kingdonia uniflora]|uniref:Uncharacterized protein n=1 Tax=Kingdonia uniflora TaxID=39325 RepID=A0A7J7MI77_9MAGN|nr:hypothetical protein GIB67_017949 [Kingdonia uniflora]